VFPPEPALRKRRSPMSRAATGPPECRSSARHHCHRPCLVRFDRAHFDGQSGSVTVPAEVVDLSACGVGLLLRQPLPATAALTVAPLGEDRPELGVARVVRCVPAGAGWLCGCALRKPLTDAELQGWLS